MASRPQLPELDFESMAAEEILGALPRGVPRPRLARLLLPEGGVGAARHALRARAGRARLRARHARPLPRDLRRLARGRAALRHEDRGLRGPDAREAGRSSTATRSGSASPTSAARSARSSRSAARSAGSTPGSPASAATSRRRARTRRRSAGTRRTSSGRRTRSPTGTTSAAGTTSASAACPTTRSTTAATPRSAAPTARSRAPAARAAGRARRRPSAACTSRAPSTSEPTASSLWLTGLSGAGQVDDRRPRRRRARGARPARRPPRRRRRPRAPLEGLGFSKEDRDTNIERIGWVASRLARAGAAVVVSAISPYEEARQKARALTEEHAPFVEVHVATSLEECERRDPKGLYAKAHAGEIAEFTGVSDPYEEPANAELRLDDRGPHAGGVGRGRPRAARGARPDRDEVAA